MYIICIENKRVTPQFVKYRVELSLSINVTNVQNNNSTNVCISQVIKCHSKQYIDVNDFERRNNQELVPIVCVRHKTFNNNREKNCGQFNNDMLRITRLSSFFFWTNKRALRTECFDYNYQEKRKLSDYCHWVSMKECLKHRFTVCVLRNLAKLDFIFWNY